MNVSDSLNNVDTAMRTLLALLMFHRGYHPLDVSNTLDTDGHVWSPGVESHNTAIITIQWRVYRTWEGTQG